MNEELSTSIPYNGLQSLSPWLSHRSLIYYSSNSGSQGSTGKILVILGSYKINNSMIRVTIISIVSNCIPFNTI
jgi:hypothetical protein